MCGGVFLDPNRLSTWLTLGANVGVLVGLALLVLEINQNNLLVRAQIEESRSQALVDWRRQIATDAGTAEILTRLFSLDFSGDLEQQFSEHFTPTERTRVEQFLTADFYDYENLFAQYQRGLVSKEYWRERAVPAIRERALLWAQFAPLHASRQAFRDEVQRILREPGRGEAP